MKCPYCGKEAIIDDKSFINVKTYIPHSAIVITRCCDSLVNLQQISQFKISEYNGNNKKDDWGEYER